MIVSKKADFIHCACKEKSGYLKLRADYGMLRMFSYIHTINFAEEHPSN